MEKMFVDRIIQFVEWRFPTTRRYMRGLVKEYLIKKGEQITELKENMPGTE